MEVFFTYRDNQFNDYVGRRVRVTVKGRKDRQRIYVGTLKAFDYCVNLVIADAYRVILHQAEEQKQDIDGLLLLRGVHVKSITYERHERNLPKWPTSRKKVVKERPKKKMEKSPAGPSKERGLSGEPHYQSPAKALTERCSSGGSQNQSPAKALTQSSASEPSTPKPLKLRRAWLTTPSPVAQEPHHSPGASGDPPSIETRMEVAQEPPKETSMGSPKPGTSGTSQGGPSVELHPVEVKEEVVVKEEKGDSPTFEDYLLNYDYGDIDDAPTKVEAPKSPGSDMSVSSQ